MGFGIIMGHGDMKAGRTKNRGYKMFTLKTQGVFERFQGEHFISSILLGLALFRALPGLKAGHELSGGFFHILEERGAWSWYEYSGAAA